NDTLQNNMETWHILYISFEDFFLFLVNGIFLGKLVHCTACGQSGRKYCNLRNKKKKTLDVDAGSSTNSFWFSVFDN
ncbi:unnamed protein product, partial [Heterotrigona itama]